MKKYFTLLIFVFLTFGVFADEKYSGWKKAETEHFNFIYENTDNARLYASAYAEIADEAWNKVGEVYSFPQDKTNVMITDRTSTVNAFTYSGPEEIMMFTTPILMSEFGFREYWPKLVFTHELCHLANFTFEDKYYVLSKMFGKTMKNFYYAAYPSWALEGFATVLETRLTDGGRGRSPYFELYCKAMTLDNAFMNFGDLGTSRTAPYSQNYVMGYLIMQNIADRWGYDALADIERNVSITKNFDESVQTVTGKLPEEIYREIQPALLKKYADERKIPEGKIITPRFDNSYYTKPAVIFDDGQMILLRELAGSNTAVVRFNPNAEDSEKEQILFEGDFASTICADKNSTVYSVQQREFKQKGPGVTKENALYKWTETDGLVRLTSGESFYSPAVSDDGTVLVAVTVKGLQMGLSLVDVQNGSVTPLLYDDDLSFVKPAVNADGSKLAFLIADGKRARIAELDLTKNENAGISASDYRIVANDSEEIFDPSEPYYDSDGTLLYNCNYRGRVEVFAVTEEKSDDGCVYGAVPVVSDPCGALWAYRNQCGIFYGSVSSSGMVIKIKPSQEWGIVPDFNGPSVPGEVVSVKGYVDDYEDFKPFEKTHEYKKREAEFAEKEAGDVKTQLSEEKKYIPLPQISLYAPFFEVVGIAGSKPAFGIGYAVLAFMPKIQQQFGFVEVDGVYFPSINNYSVNANAILPIKNHELDICINRMLYPAEINEKKQILEDTSFSVGGKYTLIHFKQEQEETDLSVISNIGFSIHRYDENFFSATDNVNCLMNFDAFTGLDFYKDFIPKGNFEQSIFSPVSLDSSLLGLFYFDLYNNYSQKVFAGAEAELNYFFGNSILFNFGLVGRYAQLPSQAQYSSSRVKLGSQIINFEYPGRLVCKAGVQIPKLLFGYVNLNVYEAAMISFGHNAIDFATPENNTFLNSNLYDKLLTEIELSLQAGRIKFGAGYSVFYSLYQKQWNLGQFHLECKLNGWRR